MKFAIGMLLGSLLFLFTGCGFEVKTNADNLPSSESLIKSDTHALAKYHHCAINDEQRLFCWGRNSSNALGVPSVTSGTLIPVEVDPSSRWLKLSVGGSLSCAIRDDRRLFCWGDSNFSSDPVPTEVAGGTSDWVSVSVSGNLVCAIRETRQLYCWGRNNHGQVGTDTSGADQLTPREVDGSATEWVEVTTGSNHACGRQLNGRVYCWGYSASLGYGASSDSHVPTQVQGGFTDWSSIKSASSVTCGLRTNGKIYCWGEGFDGQLGVAGLTNSSVPIEVVHGRPWKVLAAGDENVCALDDLGKGYCWGDNSSGQIGDLTFTGRDIPTAFAGSETWTSIVTGGGVTCVTNAQSKTLCWGENRYGNVGTGKTSYVSEAVNIESSVTDWAQVSASTWISCGVRPNGELYCWGDNFISGSWWAIPTQVAGNDWAKVSVGSNSVCALKTSGRLFCWGRNDEGQLGIGSNTDAATPTEVSGATADWADVTVGYSTTCAIKTSGRLFCWGDNGRSHLWNAANPSSNVPVEEPGAATDWLQVDLHFYHGCAINTSGRLFCWGRDVNGSLGTGTSTSSDPPVEVAGAATDWRQVSVGYHFTCAVKTSGRLFCWGSNFDGQLGDGTTTHQASPVEVPGAATDWVSVNSHSYEMTCAIKTNGSLHCTAPGVAISARYNSGWSSVSLSESGFCGLQTNGKISCLGETPGRSEYAPYFLTPQNILDF